MLTVGSAAVRTCQGLTRRELLRVAGTGLAGMTLAGALRESAARDAKDTGRREVSCIVLWLDGGPSHFETFDPKPLAPDTIRGPYGAIPTKVPGVHISELLPQTAGLLHKCAIIRSMTHGNGGHSPIPMLTAFDNETTSYGAVIAKLAGFEQAMPPYVHIGSRLPIGGGSLGAPYNPLEVRDPAGKKIELPQFSLSADITSDRFLDRRQLLAAVDRMRAQADAGLVKLDRFHQLAVDILTSPTVREAFDLTKEKDSLRERYGASFFGQSCLMARRLVEAGTRFVQIKWYEGPAWDGWDVHGADLGGMERMEHHLCPRLDQGLTALIEDLSQRGLLDTTLVIAVGEFGRTPQINKYGARDHWPACFSALLAGGGVPGGTVVGTSDKHGAQPASRPVSPPQFAATLYRLMGFNLTTDPRMRTFVKDAAPVAELA
jgi:hypothetical protein